VKNKKLRFTLLMAVVAAALVTAAAATAASITATATLTGAGALSLNLPSNPSMSATLAGVDQTVSYSPVLGLVDARGTGAGWNLTMAATTFSDGAGHTLAAGTVTSATAACHTGSTCTAPTSSVTYGFGLSTTATKVFNAAVNTGLGQVDVTPTVQIAVPGNAYAGTYTSTVTIAAVSGP
jgi:hypothetical protein